MTNIDKDKFTKKHSPYEEIILSEYIRLHSLHENNNWFSKLNLLLTTKNILNFYIYSFIFVYITLHNILSQLIYYSPLDLLCIIVFNLFAADFVSGFVHIYLDHSKIRFDGSTTDFHRLGFQTHHLYPDFQWIMDPSYQAHYETITLFPIVIPACLINNLTIQNLSIYIFSYCCLLFQAGHYWAHATTHHKYVPRFAKLLQNTGIIIHPKTHQKHHQTYDNNYCILNGWSNFIFNYLEHNTNILDHYVKFIDMLI